MIDIDDAIPAPTSRPKRGPRPNAAYAELDLAAIAEIKSGKFKSTLEAAKAYAPRYWPKLYDGWSNEHRNMRLKDLRKKLDGLLNK